jgi:putative tributyrin esterase
VKSAIFQKNEFMKKILILILFLLIFVGVGYAQKADVTVVELGSKLMDRKMPYSVILPVDYDKDKMARFPVVYLLHGLFGNYKNWTEKADLPKYANQHRFIIVTIEGGNGWYTDSATVPNNRYESYVLQELIPEIDKNYRTVADRGGRAVAGLSMGGFGALKFGAKFPDKFAFAASMSGAVGAASWRTVEDIPPPFKSFLLPVFGDEKSQTKQNNDLFKIFKEISADKISSLPFFYLDCGTEDPLLTYNQQLAEILLQRKIPHEYRQLPGKHEWSLWSRQIVDVLNISERIFNSQTKTATAANRL